MHRGPGTHIHREVQEGCVRQYLSNELALHQTGRQRLLGIAPRRDGEAASPADAADAVSAREPRHALAAAATP